jgi:hypothetical protein
VGLAALHRSGGGAASASGGAAARAWRLPGRLAARACAPAARAWAARRSDHATLAPPRGALTARSCVHSRRRLWRSRTSC